MPINGQYPTVTIASASKFVYHPALRRVLDASLPSGFSVRRQRQSELNTIRLSCKGMRHDAIDAIVDGLRRAYRDAKAIVFRMGHSIRITFPAWAVENPVPA